LTPGDPETLAERAAQRIEADILAGALAPGGRLGIVDTAERYGVGATPLREALSRLAARGLVDAAGNRGFRVKPISREDLVDIVRVRTVLEREALRLSIAAGDDAWEGAIVAALHRLKRYIGENPRGFREGEPAFDRLHKGFHVALIAACDSTRMLAACSSLYDETYRYRRLMMAVIPGRELFAKEHERLAEATLERRKDEAMALLTTHIFSTVLHVYPEALEQAR
jgi:GntR family transcriptional regulator, carbon starvation induced regulator